MQKVLKTLGFGSVIGVLLIIVAGAVVTKTGSGDGCGPNWPLCHGRIIPPEPTLETVLEYTHRLVTGIVGLIVFVFSIWCLVKYRHLKEVVWVAIASIFFLVFQSGMGALAVVFGQSATVMALHFGLSLLSYASVFILFLYTLQLSRKDTLPISEHGSSRVKWSTLSLWVYTYIVVYLGALVRHTSAEGGCTGWPLCNGQLIPTPLTGTTAIHFTHRLAALLFLIGFILFFYYIWKHHRNDRLLYRYTTFMFLLSIAQVISGGALIWFSFDIYASLIHALIITVHFGFLSYLALYVFRKPVSVQFEEQKKISY